MCECLWGGAAVAASDLANETFQHDRYFLKREDPSGAVECRESCSTLGFHGIIGNFLGTAVKAQFVRTLDRAARLISCLIGAVRQPTSSFLPVNLACVPLLE